jgi:hypothetical protein
LKKAMPLTDRERQKLELIESRGYPVDWAAAYRAFNLTCSPIVTAGVPSIEVLVSLAGLTSALVEKTGKPLALTGIVVFPTICDSAIYSTTNKLTHKRKDNAYFVRRTIEFDEWNRARRPKRLRLAVENFEESIAWIPERHFPSVDREFLLNCVHAAAMQLVPPNGKAASAVQPFP